MGFIHTPRALYSIGKGLWKGRQVASSRSKEAMEVGMGPTRAHTYTGSVSLFDVDYLGHLNNAAYWNHAEYARWEMTASNGTLASTVQHKLAYLVTGGTIRFRKEIRPAWKTFIIDTYYCGIDDKSIYIMQNFRYPTADDKTQKSRVLAQILIRGAVVKGRDTLNPRQLLLDVVGIDEELVGSLTLPALEGDKEKGNMEQILEHYSSLETSLRTAASLDDEERK